jgi:hypothetical protein
MVVAGAVMGVERVEDDDEAFGGFVIEDYGGGEDAVAVRVGAEMILPRGEVAAVDFWALA